MEFSFTKDYVLENNDVRLTPLKTSHINPLLKISNDDFNFDGSGFVSL